MPSKSVFTVQAIPQFRDIRGRFQKADKSLLDEKRKSVAELGRRWVEYAREEAPKNTGEFAKTIAFRTFIQGNAVGFRTYVEQPLGRWIIEGTEPHKIEPVKARALYFYWPVVGYDTIVPMGGGFPTHADDKNGIFWIGKGYVDHPGTEPNPFIERATKRWNEDLEKEKQVVAKRWVVVAVGGEA